MRTSCRRETSWSTAASATPCGGSTDARAGGGRSPRTRRAGPSPSTTTSSTSFGLPDACDHEPMAVGIGDWTATRELNGIYADARELGLEPNIAELTTYGFTTVPEAMAPELVERLIAAINDSVSETTGRAPDME